MNKVDVYIEDIIEESKQIINDDFCGWSIKVIINMEGIRKERLLTSTSKKDIDKYIIGYSWAE